jgi:hypothetical protein
MLIFSSPPRGDGHHRAPVDFNRLAGQLQWLFQRLSPLVPLFQFSSPNYSLITPTFNNRISNKQFTSYEFFHLLGNDSAT